MSDFPPYRTSRASLLVEHCYWSTLLAASPWILAMAASGLTGRRVGVGELIVGLAGIVVWTQSWLTVPVLWMMVLAWCIRAVRAAVGHRHAHDVRGRRTDLLVCLAPEWLLTCAAAALTSLVLFERWVIAAFGGPEEGPYPDPGYQSGSYVGIYLIALLLPAILVVARPWLVLHLRHSITRTLVAASELAEGGQDHTDPSGRKTVEALSERFLEHSICTMLAAAILVGLGRSQLLPYDPYVLGEVLETPTNLLVATLWLQGLVTIPLAWTMGVLSCGKRLLRFVARTHEMASDASTGNGRLKVAGWIGTCVIAACLCAEIGISGSVSIASPVSPELRQQAWFEFVALALLPLMLQLGIMATKRRLRTVVRHLRTTPNINTLDRP